LPPSLSTHDWLSVTAVHPPPSARASSVSVATTGTPATVHAVTTRGYATKSDAGSRTAAVQLKSGATTVTSTATALTTSNWSWLWRTDTVDPATSAAWTATAVNNATVGPTVVS
jgi:hypothetical protein